jgi:hypothetical protein
MRRYGAALLAAALLMSVAGCGGQELDGWTSQQSVSAALERTDPIRPPDVAPLTKALDASSRVSVTVPEVYRVELTGEVGRDGFTEQVAVGGWLLVVAPYDAEGASGNDVNVVDFGLRTDTEPLDAVPGALWFGSHTAVMAEMDLGGVTPNAGPLDIVTETVDGDLLVVEVIPQLAPVNTLNLFDVDTGGQLGAVGACTVLLRFSPDGSALVGRVDLVDPVTGAEYHADLVGTRS